MEKYRLKFQIEIVQESNKFQSIMRKKKKQNYWVFFKFLSLSSTNYTSESL